jgi:uncharacterized membrane protein
VADSTAPEREPLRPTPNEEILGLVDARGGRVEQAEIVDAVEWSPATVSRRLGELEDDGRVVRFPVGRRKLVCLPGSEPSAARSPFEA